MQTSGIDLTTKTVAEAHRLRANLCFRVKALRACRPNTTGWRPRGPPWRGLAADSLSCYPCVCQSRGAAPAHGAQAN